MKKLSSSIYRPPSFCTLLLYSCTLSMASKASIAYIKYFHYGFKSIS